MTSTAYQTTPRLSVIVPAYNEVSRIEHTVQELLRFLASLPYDSEVIIVDDGSEDETARVAADAADAMDLCGPRSHNPSIQFRLVTNGSNRGKGYSVRRGMHMASGELALFLDADLSTPLDEWFEFEQSHERGADVCIGSRALPGADVQVFQPWWRQRMGQVFSLIKSAVVLSGVPDSQCGFKSFNRKARYLIFSQQTVDGFAFDVEILVIAREQGLHMEQLPVTWRNSPVSRVHPIYDSARMLLDLASIRWRLSRGFYVSKNGNPSSSRKLAEPSH